MAFMLSYQNYLTCVVFAIVTFAVCLSVDYDAPIGAGVDSKTLNNLIGDMTSSSTHQLALLGPKDVKDVDKLVQQLKILPNDKDNWRYAAKALRFVYYTRTEGVSYKALREEVLILVKK